jgi:hypothetical protein
MSLPHEPRGFAVDLQTRTVHKRHAPHALGFRRTTAAGVESLLGYEPPDLCPECWPPSPKPVRTTKAPTSQRFTPVAVKLEESVPNAETLLSDREAKMAKADDGADDES